MHGNRGNSSSRGRGGSFVGCKGQASSWGRGSRASLGQGNGASIVRGKEALTFTVVGGTFLHPVGAHVILQNIIEEIHNEMWLEHFIGTSEGPPMQAMKGKRKYIPSKGV